MYLIGWRDFSFLFPSTALLKRKISILLLIFLLLAGGGYFAVAVFKIEIKAKLAQILLQNAWHKTIMTGEEQKPWKSLDGAPILRLIISNYEVDQIVLKGTSGQNLAFGPSLHLESQLPGNGGTTILSSHRDTHGIYIKKLKIGDIIKLQDRYKQWHTYQIDNFSIINVNQYSYLALNTQDNLLIITCYPFNSIRLRTPLRYVVSASKNKIQELSIN